MRGQLLSLAIVTLGSLWGAAQLPAQSDQHAHHHGDAAASEPPVERPKVFLDKSPRIVQYQLSRLDNRRLLLVERATDDAKYAPVYEAILQRPGMTAEHRQEALAGLVTIHQSNAVAELLRVLAGLSIEDKESARTFESLGAMLVALPKGDLQTHAELLREAWNGDEPKVQSVAAAALIMAGQLTSADLSSADSVSRAAALLQAVALAPQVSVRDQFAEAVVERFQESTDTELTRQAIRTLGTMSQVSAETYAALVGKLPATDLRNDIVNTLLRLPKVARNSPLATSGAEFLVTLAEQTPAEARTEPKFLDAMQLADQFLAAMPVEAARQLRGRLREVTVRVIQIHTVEEEMRYDIPYFAVEAGRPVQVVLKNVDIMPHNLVLTVPGALQEVAELGLQIGPDKGWQGKAYVPESEKVLYATEMVEADKQARLTFTAPSEPGEYPYVCTFPRHWMRMHGVMVVVEDLDAWLENPVEPASPIGSQRSFVKSWTVDDFAAGLDQGLRGRSHDIGRRLFAEATCRQCHQAEAEGGRVGPSLDGLLARWKGDRLGVLREILDPSHRIDPKYAMHLVLTVEGRTITGIIMEENKQQIALLANPESTEPTVIKQADIEEVVKTSTSMMPKGLLDQFTQDEVLELLAYVLALESESPSP